MTDARNQNTRERYFKRVALPVMAVAALSITVVTVVVFWQIRNDRSTRIVNERDLQYDYEAPSENTNEAKPLPYASTTEFSEQARDALVSELRESLNILERTAERLEAEPSGDNPNISELNDTAERKVRRLASADASQWNALRKEASKAVQDYAKALGQDLEDINAKQ